MTKARFLLVILIVFTISQSWAQKNAESNDNQLALQYYRNGEFEKAAVIYQRLYDENRSKYHYQYFLNCLVNLKEFEKAESLIKDQQKADKNDLSSWVDLGYIYSLQNNEPKAKSTYQNAIKKLTPDHNQIINLANAFTSIRLYNYAEEAYNQGEKLLKGSYGFQMEKGQLFFYTRDYDKMIAAYLDLLEVDEQYIQTVQNSLQNAIYNDIDESLKEKLKAALLYRVNKSPNILVYSELLVWIFIQDNDFESAFIQARALDMRLNENGKRILELARLATENNNFNVAVEAYNYVIKKGKNLEFYFAARNEMLDVMYKRIVLGIDNTHEAYIQMELAFINALQEMGTNVNTVDVLQHLAHLQAFYLGKTTEALFLLEDAVTLRGLSYMQKGQLELELADIYLVDGKVWDATLSYARVEEDNKNNPIGSEAKFRKARLAYYIGNFEWARAQLDVLKASTSKLMANDAAELSLFIFENTGWDSVETAMEIYARADFLFYQSKDSLVIQTLDSLIALFPSHEVIDEAWLLKGKTFQRMHNFDKAIECYQTIVANYYYDILADNAVYAIADIYEKELNNKEKAMEMYKKVMVDFPSSIYKMESRLRFRALRGDEVVN